MIGVALWAFIIFAVVYAIKTSNDDDQDQEKKNEPKPKKSTLR